MIKTSLGLDGDLASSRGIEHVGKDGEEVIDVRQDELRLVLEQVENCSERRLVLDGVVLQGQTAEEDGQDLRKVQRISMLSSTEQKTTGTRYSQHREAWLWDS